MADANLIKKVGLKHVAVADSDILIAGGIKINGGTYTNTEFDKIATNEGNISTNATNISNNAANISTNASNIATNTSDIAALSNAQSYGAYIKAMTATDAPAEGGTVNVPFADDDAPSIDGTGYAVDDLIIFDADGNGANRKVGKISAIDTGASPHTLTITYSGVDALEDNKLHHVELNFLASPDSQEKRVVAVVESAKMTVISAEIWDSAEAIMLASGYAAADGTIAAGDSVQKAISNLDYKIQNTDTGANKALSNLENVSINQSLTFDSSDTYDIGDTSNFVHAVYLNKNVYYGAGGQAAYGYVDGYNFKFNVYGNGAGNYELTTRSIPSGSTNAGKINFTAGNAVDGNGGNIELFAGTASGSGENGSIILQGEGVTVKSAAGNERGAIVAYDQSGEEGLYVVSINGNSLTLMSDEVESGSNASADVKIHSGKTDSGKSGDVSIFAGESTSGEVGTVYIGSTLVAGDRTLSVPNNGGDPIGGVILTKEYNSGKYGVFFNGDAAADTVFFQSCAPNADDMATPDMYIRSGINQSNSGTASENDSGDVWLTTGDSSNGDSGDLNFSVGSAANGTQGSIIFHALPKGAAYVAPVNDEDVVMKKYVDDELANSASSTVNMLLGESVSAGDVCYLKNDGKAYKAIASGLLNREDLEFIYIAAAGGASGDSIEMIIPRTDVSLSGASVGTTYYLSDSTAGGMVTSAPTTAGHDVVLIGRSQTADEMMFSPVYLMTN